MTASSKLPLTLFQVLEDEFEALYGEPAQNRNPVKLPGYADSTECLEVIPTANWEFDPTHIKDPAGLFAELAPESTKPADTATVSGLRGIIRGLTQTYSSDPDKLARKKLKQYLNEKLSSKKADEQSSKTDGKGVTGLYERLVRTTPSRAEVLAETLNQLLDDPDLFHEERFSNYWLSPATRAMRDTHTRFGGPPLTGDELRHFNRLLLEDAFPRFVERIHRIRLAAVYQRIHEKQPVALCLSGGGIRSGTFALGVLQGLARHKLLDEFHYLSTVSGGGYIGSWLAAWIHRHRRGLRGVTAELANSAPRTKIDPDPAPIRYLRRYSNFITPKVGLLTADTWTFISIYLRNLFLNWLVFIPAILLGLLLPRLVVSATIAPLKQLPWGSIPTPFGNFELLTRRFFLIAGVVCTVWSLTYIIFNRPTVREELRQASAFWRRQTTQRGFLWWCLLPLAVSAFCLTTYWAWSSQSETLPKAWWWFVLFGVISTGVAWFLSSIILGRIRLFTSEFMVLVVVGALGGAVLYLLTTAFDPFGPAGPWRMWSRGLEWTWLSWTTEIYACLAAPVFLLVVLLGVTLFIGGTSKIRRVDVDDEDREWWARLTAWVLIVIVAWIAFTTVVIFGPLVLLRAPGWLASVGGISGILAALVGQSALTPATSKSTAESDSAKGSILRVALAKSLTVLAIVFIAILLTAFSLSTSVIFQRLALIANNNLPGRINEYLSNAPLGFSTYLQTTYFNLQGKDVWERAQYMHMNVIHLTSVLFVLLVALVLFLAAWAFSRAINLNIFSLHAGYRNRLIRAFLGASRPDHQRKPNPFTGFDPADNVSMYELRAGLFNEADLLDVVALANVLSNPRTPEAVRDFPNAAPVVDYLQANGFLDNLGRIHHPETFSLKLVAAIRKDLNAALQDPGLHRKFPSGSNGSGKTINDIALNRAVLQNAFPNLIEQQWANGKYRMMPVINTTLNLVGGDNLAWQQRKAEPFTVTPLHSGCFRLGYRDSRFFGGQDTGGISIGTIATVSGAAASSNMGYYTTSPVLSLVLTFFNVRLGWWLGNPGTAGDKTFGQPAPTSSVLPVLDEAFGLTDDKNPYVYLTDGGHFENLGLYEMVLRRCHVIVVSDAAADGDYRFGDLGNAIRKVRIDLGIPIEFTAMPIFRDVPEGKKAMYWAVGKIRYGCIDGAGVKDGLLLYIKPAVYEKEPRDVLEYKKSHPEFPHQTTADQFFDEPQFESYRILGSHIADQICGSDNSDLVIRDVVRKAVEQLLATQNNGPADPDLDSWWQIWEAPQPKKLPPAPAGPQISS